MSYYFLYTLTCTLNVYLVIISSHTNNRILCSTNVAFIMQLLIIILTQVYISKCGFGYTVDMCTAMYIYVL